MYRLELTADFSAAHSLRDYPGICANTHGHNWRLEIILNADSVDDHGMTADYADLKSILDDIVALFDHQLINDMDYFREVNPTSEAISKFVFERYKKALEGKNLTTVRLVEVKISETPEFSVTYRPE